MINVIATLQQIKRLLGSKWDFGYINLTSDGNIINSTSNKTIILKKISINNGSDNFGTIELKNGSTGSTILVVALAERGGLACFDFGDGFELTLNTSLYANLTTTDNVNFAYSYELR